MCVWFLVGFFWGGGAYSENSEKALHVCFENICSISLWIESLKCTLKIKTRFWLPWHSEEEEKNNNKKLIAQCSTCISVERFNELMFVNNRL